MRELYEVEQELQQLIDSAIEELRAQLRQEASDLVQNYTVESGEVQTFAAPFARSNSVSLWDKSSDNIADIGTFAALSTILPVRTQAARLPSALQGEAVFRPALRRLGTLAGRSAAAVLFDSSGGTIGYSNRQAGQRLMQELFS